MRTINFYDYVSKRYATNDTRESRVRELVYAFKSGQRAAVDHAVKVVSDLIIKWYGVDCESYVFCCVPASNNGKYIRRFKRFVDDLITTGETANEFAAELESVGANVLGAMFLARTKMMNN